MRVRPNVCVWPGKTRPYHESVSIHDENDVFMLRLYRECNNDGAILCASKNHSECIDVPPHVLHLPVGKMSIEPSICIQASAILTSLCMHSNVSGSYVYIKMLPH